jgi:hypothetical protein
LIRHDVGVADGGLQERLDRDERIERVMQHVVAVPDELEDLVDVVAPPHDPRRESHIFELRSVQPDELHPIAKSQPVRRADQHLVVNFEILDEDVEHAARHPLFDLQQRRRSMPELP